ncbi:hypothetical protein [Streptomyces sp. HUAS TT20]|uniref:hypothetical protein n=1 Tax=Streptomyces sp. HUAS TT20 TaxID=3447509 RepID=UPI0021D965C0|nr:hypothetical protein [Streptomyces sp. HUAS 15-9]UXY28815.1 hypothetical protein N8I87_21170 [Streptomyces sp. HUAS 15-9]
MHWTDESGAAYGEDPYAGAGYAYAPGHQGSGGTVPDTATLSWYPGQPGQWSHTADRFRTTGPAPLVTAVWDAPHGDVFTAMPPDFGTPTYPVPEPSAPESEPAWPVFVDSSGRRQRRVLRAARLLVIPAGGYVALLISALLGGPSISSPFVPQPDSAHRTTPHATASDSASGTGHSEERATPAAAQKTSPAARQTPGSADGSTASTVPAATSGPTSPSPTSTAPVATPTSKGRALGTSHKPVK